jgi:hypothetical protein
MTHTVWSLITAVGESARAPAEKTLLILLIWRTLHCARAAPLVQGCVSAELGLLFYRVRQDNFYTSNLTSGSCCVYHIFSKVGSVVADIISFTFCKAHNILISWVRTLEVIRRPALDLTRARAWPWTSEAKDEARR